MQSLPFTDTNNFSYYVTQYYCILLLDVSGACVALLDGGNAAAAAGITALCAHCDTQK